MVKKVYAVVYDDCEMFDEWYYTLNEAISSALMFGGCIYTSLIPNESWNFYDVGKKLKKVAVVQNPRKWRIKNV